VFMKYGLLLLAPRLLVVFGNQSFYMEGVRANLLCRNFNTRPGFRGQEIWTNSNGERVGTTTFTLTVTRDNAGDYTCSVPTVPEILPFVYKVVAHCKFCKEYDITDAYC